MVTRLLGCRGLAISARRGGVRSSMALRILPVPTEARTLGEHLHKARHERGLTRKAAADAIGVSEAAVQSWENGTHFPRSGARTRAVAWLGFDPGTDS